MKIITDHFTLVGKSTSHVEHGCQDYAYSFQSGDLAVAMVADGCSSAPNSDVGARLIVLSAGRILASWLPGYLQNGLRDRVELHGLFKEKLIRDLSGTFEQLNEGSFLGPLLLDCTLVAAVRYKNIAVALMLGDGFVSVDYKNGDTVVQQSDFIGTIDGVQRSMPYYPAYDLPAFAKRKEAYVACTPSLHTEIRVHREGQWRPAYTYINSDWSTPFVIHDEAEMLNSITVSSDGIGSFGGGMDFNKDVADELLKFPANMNGNILKRKMLFHSARTWPKKRFVHGDDLGLATIRIF